jgi:UDP-2,3-diacylglucosamine hydrolase
MATKKLPAMKTDIFFISDLHLALEKPALTAKFLNFLRNQATQARAIYILGDLFDVWVGDDDFFPPIYSVKKQLKQLTASGTLVFLQPGNRDFLVGQQFCTETGVTLLADYAVIELNGVKTLLTHGDLLCTDDLPYQAFRAKSHTNEWQQQVLSKPLILRLFVARWYRLRSFFHKRGKTAAIMDVNQETVVTVMRQYHVERLIHGHTHRPAVHTLSVDAKTAQRFVLTEWKPQVIDLLAWNSQGYYLLAY